ncbi:MAG: tetratricopeptide repeat protein [Leptolyngbya sp.]|nr:tetratricopeptide repeat protein [Candidatus Melainabacteria bacterium]
MSTKPVSKPAARQPDVTNMRPSDLQLHNLAIARAGQDIELNLDNAGGKKNSQTRTRMRSAFKNQGVDARLIVVVVALVAAAAGYWFILKPTLDKPAPTKVVDKNPAQQVFAQGKYAKAIEMLEKKDAAEALTEEETDMLHSAHYKQAEVLVKQKHFADAKKLLKKIPDDSPHSAKAKALTKKYRALRR